MISYGDNELLQEAIKLTQNNQIEKNTIGLLQEHDLHKTLKNYFSIDKQNQEIKIGNMFADIMINNHIYEIQTKQFNLLREKLSFFLKDYQVTIIYPIAENKVVHLLDKDGSPISIKKSPRHGNPFELFVEAYKIKSYLKEHNLSFKIVMLDIDEIREKEEQKRYHSKGFIRINQIPKKINEIITLENHNDYLELMNQYELPNEFDSKIFSKVTHVLKTKASTILNVLLELNVVERIGKNGRSYLYKIRKEN